MLMMTHWVVHVASRIAEELVKILATSLTAWWIEDTILLGLALDLYIP
jgi:hypothetical protein